MNWLHSFWGLGAIIGPLSISLFIGLQNGWRLGYLVISLAHFSIVLLLFTTLKKWQAKENDKDESIELNNDDFKKIGKKAMFAIFSSYLIYMLIESAIILWGATNYGGYIDASHSGEYSSGYYGYQIIYSLKKDEVLSFQIGSDYKGAANFGFSFINNNFEYDLENTNYIERLIYFPDGFEFKINVTETTTYYLYFTENVTIKSDEEYISNGQFHIIELFAEENYYITPDAYDLKVRFKMPHIEENIVTTVNIVDGYGVYSMNSEDLIVLKLNIEKQGTYTLGISDEMYMFSWSSYNQNNDYEVLNYMLFHGDSFNPNIENNNYIYLSYNYYKDNYEITIYIEFYDK